jgi:hypothetical protein
MGDERNELNPEELSALGIQRGSDALLRKLAEPFPANAVGWKPQSVKGSRALAIAYIDVRDVMDRLDDVVGPASWEDDYQLTADNPPSFLCTLRIRLGDRWISKRDVGGCSDQPDPGDRIKSACSDALKRTAVKFGIGRYLYRLAQQWVDYDPVKRQFTRPPALPIWALPRKEQDAELAKKPAPNNSQLRDGRGMERPIPLVKADEIFGLLKEAGISREYFCRTFGIEKITDLTESRYAEAVERIKAKIKPAA